MSNYTPTTNFGAKDALPSGNPGKLILGAQLSTEFTNIATSVATKVDAATSPNGAFTLTGTGFSGSAPTASATYVNVGNTVTITVPGSFTGTSNDVVFTMTGLPVALQPVRTQVLAVPQYAMLDNGAGSTGASVQVSAASGTISFRNGSSQLNGWTNTGTKGVNNTFSFTYLLV